MLGAATAIVGGNRTGKTTLLDAAHLALVGKHPIGHDGIHIITGESIRSNRKSFTLAIIKS